MLTLVYHFQPTEEDLMNYNSNQFLDVLISEIMANPTSATTEFSRDAMSYAVVNYIRQSLGPSYLPPARLLRRFIHAVIIVSHFLLNSTFIKRNAKISVSRLTKNLRRYVSNLFLRIKFLVSSENQLKAVSSWNTIIVSIHKHRRNIFDPT